MSRSYVVTGGGGGIGRAIVERLLGENDAVVVIDDGPDALRWIDGHPAGRRLIGVRDSAADETAANRAAELAGAAAPLASWVNNAAVFRDALLHDTPATELSGFISRNIDLALVGCRVAIRAFLGAGAPGAIVNVSSHQARRAVPGCLPYVTAKAAIEGLTRALAVDYGPAGIRVNAVAPGTIVTGRYEDDLRRLGPETGGRVDRETRRLHALGRNGQPAEVAEAVACLLSDAASFISGATVPNDGGRAVLGREPER